MTYVEIELIPDGMSELPVEARDDSIVWSHLQGVTISADSILSSMRDVERITSKERVKLRIPNTTMADHSSTTLTNIQSALTNNISGLKAHPDGWYEDSEPTQ